MKTTYRGGALPKADAEKSLNCHATGCPLRWSVSPGKLCSHHAWAEPKTWPSITDRLLAREAQQQELSTGVST